MGRISQKLQPFVDYFTHLHRYSDDVHWIAYRDFKYAKYISPSFEKAWGYSSEPILQNSRAWDKCVLSCDLKSHHPLLEMVKKIKRDGPFAHYNETYRVIKPDGSLLWILDKGHPIYDNEGEYLGVTGVAIDITLLKTYGQFPIQPGQHFPENGCRSRYYLQGRYKYIYLTLSEAKCAFYLLQGKTAKQTAKLLSLSPRTIEEVLSHIKRKLGVVYRAEVYEALIEGNFIHSLTND